MKESYSGLFKRNDAIPHSGLSRVPSGASKDFGKHAPSMAAKEKPKSPTHSSNVGGKEELHPDAQSAINRVKGKGGYVTRLRDQGIEYKEDKVANVANVAHEVAKELSEAWWCGTPEVMEKERKKTPPPTVNQPKGADLPNMASDDKMNLEHYVNEASYKVGKASKPKQPKAGKPNKVKPAANEDPAMEHARQIVKMAKAVSASVYSGPLDILAAAYAKHTFHPDNIGEEVIDERHQTQAYKARKQADPSMAASKKMAHHGEIVSLSSPSDPEYKTDNSGKYLPLDILTHKGLQKSISATNRASDKNRREAAEAIVNKFLEDTMTGDVASMAIGFAPTGEMDPHEGRPGKKKKKKGQFQELGKEVAGGSYGRLARKVAGNMSGV